MLDESETEGEKERKSTNWSQAELLTMDMGNPPSSSLSALKAACSNSRSLASFCLAALCASDLQMQRSEVSVS